MITVEGQYALNMTVGDREFLKSEDIEYIDIIERAGTDMPVFQASFLTNDHEVIQLLSERQLVKISLGSNSQDMLDYTFTILQPRIDRRGKGKWKVHIEGLSSGMKAWHTPAVSISPAKSGVERIMEVAKQCFGQADSNIEKSQDSQKWIQHGIPTKTHVSDIWMHCNLPGSFPLLAVTMDGFRLRDAKTLIKSEPKWIFSNGESGENVYPFDGDYQISSSSGMMNSLAGRGITQGIHMLHTGQFSYYKSEPMSIMSMTGNINVDEDMPLNNPQPAIQTRNHHETYWQTYAHNVTQFCLYSSYTVKIGWRNKYIPVRPLDLVMFKDDDVVNTKQSVEEYSGLYIVSKVSRRLAGRTFATRVSLVRESFKVK